MKPMARGKNEKFLAALLLIATATLPATTLAREGQPRRGREWKVQNSEMRLHLEGGSLVCATRKDGTLESIPISAITELLVDTQTRAPVKEAIDRELEWDWEDFDWSPIQADPRQAAAVPLIPVAFATQVAMMEPFRWVKTRSQFVHIVWQQDGRERSQTFWMSKGDARSLVAELSEATGKRWTSFDLADKLKERKGRLFLVHLPGDVAVGNTHFLSDTYPVLFLQGESDEGLVYFFLNRELTPDHILAVMPVKIEPTDSTQPPSAVFARDSHGVLYLAELRLRSKTLRLCGPSSEF